MKKILLIIPPKGEIKDIKQMDSQFPRIGIAYIAAYLRENGHQVKILDAIALNLDAEKIKDELKKERPDFIGLGPFTEEIFRAYKVCEMAKEINKDIITVFGGPHASAMPKETLEEFPLVDYVIYGEGEETFLKLVNGETLADINGIAYRNNKNIIVNKPACPIRNLDSLPYPAWDLYPLHKYKGSLNKNFYRKMNILNLELPVLSVRGCPGNCNFCYKIYQGLRLRDPIKVVDEIEFLINTYKVTDIFFSEGTFLAKSEHGLKICKELIGRGLNKKISWVAETRVNIVDEVSLRLMKEAGCEELYYGIETGDEKILKNSKKGITFDQMKNAVKITKKAGIKPTCFSIIGHPYETEESIDKTINLLIKLNSDMMNIAIMMPFPGTEIRKMALNGKGNYRLLSNDWSTYTKQQGGPLELDNLPLTKLQKLQSKGYIKYFLRPQKIPYILSHFSLKKIKEIFIDLIKKAF
ncbi:MAG: B12-binding domain-containing radical SAM protein [Candidatus Staskawiczbacteria bacterium]|nr:B12-binding domain-containing radical SAM protein [Candidatus Staskawiczbacteria bacterium]